MDELRPIRPGTRWWGGTSNEFIVIAEHEADDGHKWIYYRDAKGDPPREYSCYKESFIQRFSPLPE